MNEAIVNEMTAISGLNRVDGFDPSRFMRKLTEVDENGQPNERMYLEVAYRKLWFRLKHPEGAIRKFMREVNDQFAINYEVDCGVFKGKKLGQVAQETPQSLEWYVTSYRGKNNVLRAAAKFLLDKASA